jgi:hypothetical protein
MKRATITITDDLEQAIERYRQDLEIPLELDAVVQRALREYLTVRGHLPASDSEDFDDLDDIIFATGPKPKPLENAPALLDGSTVAEAVIEDRRQPTPWRCFSIPAPW